MNESALKDASKMYSISMDDWLKNSTKPFITVTELSKQRQMIQEKATDQFKSQLKGPNDEFTYPFLNKLKQVCTFKLKH